MATVVYYAPTGDLKKADNVFAAANSVYWERNEEEARDLQVTAYSSPFLLSPRSVKLLDALWRGGRLSFAGPTGSLAGKRQGSRWKEGALHFCFGTHPILLPLVSLGSTACCPAKACQTQPGGGRATARGCGGGP